MAEVALPDIRVEAGLTSDNPIQVSTSLILDDATFGLLDTGTLGTSITWTDISEFVRSFTISRSSDRNKGPVVQFQAGTCSVVLDNSGGEFDPDNLMGPYVVDGVSQIDIMVPIRILVEFQGTVYYLFSGFADSWTPAVIDRHTDYTEITLSATDAFKIFNNVSIPTSTGVGASEDTGARISRILTAIDWYTDGERRSIDTGNSTLQATTLGDTALNLMQIATDSELGQLYIGGKGDAVFKSRHALLTDPASSTVQAIFGDSGNSSTDTTYDELIAAASPLAWWKLDEPTGVLTATDSSGNGHDASATEMAFGNVSQAIPGNDSASLLASNSPQIISSYNPSFSSGITVECWVNLNYQSQGGNNPRLIANSHTDSDNNGFQLMLTSAGQPQFWVGSGSGSGNSAGGTVPSVGWTHLVGTYDGSNINLYVNGMLAAGPTGFSGNVAAGSASGIGIGYNPAYNGDYLSGLIAECSVSSGAITADEVLARYDAAPIHAELFYAALNRQLDDTTMANDVQATRVGGTAQQVSDSASITKYLFKRSYSRDDLILEGDSDALSWAQWVLYIGKDGENRFQSVEVDPFADPDNLWLQVLAREFSDRIQVWQRPPGVDTPITKDAFIVGIEHTCDVVNTVWRTTWTLQSADKYGSFVVLDDAILGELDRNALAF